MRRKSQTRRETRGRPPIKNPKDRRGAVRGASLGTIELFKKVCYENERDPAIELENKLREIINEIGGIEAKKSRLREIDAELNELNIQREKIMLEIRSETQ